MQRIRRVAADSGLIDTYVGNGTSGFSGDGYPARNALLGPNQPWIAVDSADNLYIADTGNRRIRKVSAATGFITTIAGNGTEGSSGDGGNAAAAQLLGGPITLDQSGNIYFVDRPHVRRIDSATATISTVAGGGTINGYSGQGDGGPAISAFFFSLSGVAVDGLGNLYISDQGSQRIRKVDFRTGMITTIAGNGVDGYAGDYLLGTYAQISQNSRLAVDAAGNVYIADEGNNRVRKVDARSGVITTVAGTGVAGFRGDNGMANISWLNYPTAVTVSSKGDLYIADDQRIRKVNASNFP